MSLLEMAYGILYVVEPPGMVTVLVPLYDPFAYPPLPYEFTVPVVFTVATWGDLGR